MDWQDNLRIMHAQMLWNVRYNVIERMHKPLDFADRIMVDYGVDESACIHPQTVGTCVLLTAAYLSTGRFATSPDAFGKLQEIIGTMGAHEVESQVRHESIVAVYHLCKLFDTMDNDSLMASTTFVSQLCTRTKHVNSIRTMAFACASLDVARVTAQPMMVVMKRFKESLEGDRVSEIREATSLIIRLLERCGSNGCTLSLKSCFLAIDMGRVLNAWLTHAEDFDLCTHVVVCTIAIAGSHPNASAMYDAVAKCIVRDVLDTVFVIITKDIAERNRDVVLMEEALLTLVLQVVTCTPNRLDRDVCLLQPFVDSDKACCWANSMAAYMCGRHHMGGCTEYTLLSWIKVYIALMPRTTIRPTSWPAIINGMNTFLHGQATFRKDIQLQTRYGDASMVSSHGIGFFMLTCMLMPPVVCDRNAIVTDIDYRRHVSTPDMVAYLKCLWTLLQEDECIQKDIKIGFLAGPMVSLMQEPVYDILHAPMASQVHNDMYEIVRSIGDRLRKDFATTVGSFDEHVEMRMVFAMRIMVIMEKVAYRDGRTHEIHTCRKVASDLEELLRGKKFDANDASSAIRYTFLKSMHCCQEGAGVISKKLVDNMDSMMNHLMTRHRNSIKDLAADMLNGVSAWRTYVTEHILTETEITYDQTLKGDLSSISCVMSCATCHAEDAGFVCGGCECVRYCDVRCQSQGWRRNGGNHKHTCLAAKVPLIIP